MKPHLSEFNVITKRCKSSVRYVTNWKLKMFVASEGKKCMNCDEFDFDVNGLQWADSWQFAVES